MAVIACINNEDKKTFEYASEAYKIACDIGDAQTLYYGGRFLAKLFYENGEIEEGVKFLNRSCQIGKQAGFSDIDKCEELLKKYKQKLNAVEQ
jgi:hypothetical protein